MDAELAKRLLGATLPEVVPDPDDATAVEPASSVGVSTQQLRAFLHTINTIISKREANYALAQEILDAKAGDEDECEDRDERGRGMSALARDVEKWAQCLSAIPMGHVGRYPDSSRRLMHLYAFYNQRVVRQHLGLDSELATFLGRTDVQGLCNDLIVIASSPEALSSTAVNSKLNEADWMGIASLVRLGGLLSTTCASIINAAANALSSVLEMTASVWDVEIDFGLRLKIESILFVLGHITSSEQISVHNNQATTYAVMLTTSGCAGLLKIITHRLEAGVSLGINGGDGDSSDSELSDAEGENKFGDNNMNNSSNATGNTGKESQGDGGAAADVLIDLAKSARLRMIKRHRKAELRLPAYRTSWCDLCLTAVVKLCVVAQASVPAAEIEAAAETAASASAQQKQAVRSSAGSGAGGTTSTPKLPSSAPVSSTLSQGLLLQEAVGMLVSPCWQRRLLSLFTLKECLAAPGPAPASDGVANKRATGQSANTSSSKSNVIQNKTKKGERILRSDISGSAGAATTASAKESSTKKPGGGSAKSSAIRRNRANKPVEEICKGGHIRSLCWNLMHEKAEIRNETANVLSLVVEATQRDQVGLDVWAAFVEQGLVPLLELIQEGIPVRKPPSTDSSSVSIGRGDVRSIGSIKVINATYQTPESTNTNTIFPEKSIRQISVTLLGQLATQLEHSSMLRLRLSSALMHSGNHTLRNNIFSGIIYITSRSATIGRSIWALSSNSNGNSGSASSIAGGNGVGSSGDSSNVTLPASDKYDCTGQVFYDMLQVLVRDPTELKPVLSAIAHILHIANIVRSSREECVKTAAHAFAKQHEGANKMGNDGNDNIRERLQGGTTVLVEDSGQLVKMLCPASAAIAVHSPDLATYLDNVAEKSLQKFRETGAEPTLAVLAGDYGLWQDIFSHMLDDGYILEQSLSRMPADKIIDAFQIARKFRMHLLIEKYAVALGKRINADTIVLTLEAALGRDSDSLEEGGASAHAVSVEGALTHLPEPAPLDGVGIDGAVHAPASPSVSGAIAMSRNRNGRLLHVRLTSQCLDYCEKHAEAVFSRRRPVRQQELLTLVHDVLGLVFFS